MKKIKIRKIQIFNFKIFADQIINFDNSDVIIFDGPNGYGKTSLFDAIELLVTGEISRLKRKIKELDLRKHFHDNVLVNDETQQIIYVKAEVSIDNEVFVLCRYAKWQENSKNNPTDFSSFKAGVLESFDTDIGDVEEVDTDYFENLFGNGFLESYPIMHYIEQDESTFLLKQKEGDRTKFLSYLFHTVAEEKEYSKTLESYEEIKKREKILGTEVQQKEAKLKELSAKNLPTSDKQIDYERTFSALDIEWDKENIKFSQERWINVLKDEVKLLKVLGANVEAIKQARINNFLNKHFKSKKILNFHVTTSNFMNQLESISDAEDTKESLRDFKEALDNVDDFEDLSNVDYEELFSLLEVKTDFVESFDKKWEELEELHNGLEENEEIFTEIKSIREALKEFQEEPTYYSEAECLFCGQEYKTKKELLSKIDKVTTGLDAKITKKTVTYSKVLSDFKKITIDKVNQKISKKMQDLEKKFPTKYFSMMLLDQEVIDSYKQFVKTIESLGVDIKEFSNKDTKNDKKGIDALIVRFEEILKGRILSVDELYYDRKFDDLVQKYYGGKYSKVKVVSKEIDNKIIYIENCISKNQSEEILKLQKELTTYKEFVRKIALLKEQVKKLSRIYEERINIYKARIISSIEAPFYIYSGRIIQTFNKGNGFIIDIDMEEQLKGVRFKTNSSTSHDALFSLSSGQLSALVISFMLALNRVYAKNNLILIDDPVQTMDDVNVSSLIELLRTDFAERQLFLSTHEDHISLYMNYKFNVAGLVTSTFNLRDVFKVKPKVSN